MDLRLLINQMLTPLGSPENPAETGSNPPGPPSPSFAGFHSIPPRVPKPLLQMRFRASPVLGTIGWLR